MSAYDNRLRSSDYFIADVEQAKAAAFVATHHYSRGCSNTAVYRHGLYRVSDGQLVGVVMWLPPTKVAAQSVDSTRWMQVLSLSRMAIAPDVPKNACSYLLGRSLRLIKRENRFLSFVTYADEWADHDGGVYRACGWQEIGRSSAAYMKWIDPRTNKQVAQKATVNRIKTEMLRLGFRQIGAYHKIKFVLYPGKDLRSRMLSLSAAFVRLKGVLR